jgi:hypothetical protein
MRLQFWRKLLRCVLAIAFLMAFASDASLSQSTPAPENGSEAQPELPLPIRKKLDAELASEAKAKKIGAGGLDNFPLPVCHHGACGAVNRDGTLAVPLAYNRVERFSEGRALVQVRHRYSYLYGYVDDTGRVISRPQFTVAGRFTRGFAQIDVDGKSGLIDRDGQVALWPQFGFAVPFTKDVFWVTEERNIIQGNTGAESFYFEHPRFVINGVSDTAIMAKGKWGLVDRSGSWIRQPEFLDVRIFDYADTQLMWAKTEAGWGLIRPDLSWQVEPKYQQGGVLGDGVAAVALDGRWGFIDATGRTVIEPRFDYVMHFVGPYAPARIDKKFGMIDRAGEWIIEPQYDMIFPGGIVTPKSWWKTKLGDKYGLLDDKLRVVLSPQFEQSLTVCEDGRVSAILDGKWRLFSRDGTPESDDVNCQGPVVYRRP